MHGQSKNSSDFSIIQNSNTQQPRTENMRWIKDKDFVGIRVEIDDGTFIRCKFTSCVLSYKGGLFKIDGCEFSPDNVWELTGAAGLTLTMLGLIRALGYDINYFIPSQSGHA